MARNNRRILRVGSAFLFLFSTTLAAGRSSPPPALPVVEESMRHDTSPPLWLIRPPVAREAMREMHRPRSLPGRTGGLEPPEAAGGSRTAENRDPGFGIDAIGAPLTSWEGTGNVDGRVPPDTTGDVGPNHVVEWVNVSFAVYDRSGTTLYGPVRGSTLWSGFGGRCELADGGDPIVLYDALADRWVVSQLAFAWPNDFHHCVAVSATADPTGAWHRYAFFFDASVLNDYPKMGVWPDAYYVAVNQVVAAIGAWRGQGALAYERDAMLQGLPARVVRFDLFGVEPNFGGALPADLDGPLPPPAGSPAFFVEVDDSTWWGTTDRLSLWRFDVDWSDPPASTFGAGGMPNAVLDLSAAGLAFDPDMCGYSRSCILQPGGSRVDALSDRLMQRLVYRNFGSHEALVVNHTVDVDGTDRAGVRWYEVRDPGGTPVLHQGGTWSPDADSRWMASAAFDGAGGIAVGYSVSSGATYPSIRYAGRLASDPPGSLAQGEATLIAGSGYQTEASRWGDYSTLTIDPTDDCTFWYLGQYYATTDPYSWQTRVGSFRLDGCGQCPLLGRPSSLTLEPEAGGTRLTWAGSANAAAYDVVEGRLSTLRSTAGDFSQAVTGCAANDLAATTLLSTSPDPAAGDATWWLVRGTRNGCRGTLDEAAASQVASRDPGVAASPSACP